MGEVAWNQGATMLSNGPEASRQNNPGAIRSQDDATVGYFFQRPQTDMAEHYSSKRWAVGDDSVIDQQGRMTGLESDFQSMGFENREMPQHAKKLWEDSGHHKGGGDGKPMFSGGHPWTHRDDSWGHPPAGDHPVSNPMMVQRRPGSFPGSEPTTVLSPRSSEASALGFNMAEYVLGDSPMGKDMDGRLARINMKHYAGPGGDGESGKIDKNVKGPGDEGDGPDGVQANGIMQNGLDVQQVDDKQYRPVYRSGGSRGNSPTDENQLVADPRGVREDLLGEVPPQALAHQHPGLQLDSQQFEPVAIDPIQYDFTSHLMPSMDSPNFGNVDFQQQQRQQQIAVVTQQQYALATQQQQQQLGLAPTTFAAPYVINAQDPYAVGIPLTGPAVVPQYYQVQTPWGIYPAGLLQQQQGGPGQQGQPQGAITPQGQQLLRSQGNTRPLTPSQGQGSEMGTPTGGVQGPAAPLQPAGYQILAPAYYDQNGQLVMGSGRGIGTPVRLVSPAPILVNAAAGQQGYPTNSNLYTPVSTSLFTPISGGGNSLGLNHGQTGYNNGSLSSLGSSTPGAIGSGSGRRDSIGSIDLKQRPQQLPLLNQYYGTLGSAASPAGPMGLVQPGQALTPPPSLTGSATNLSLAGLGSGRLYSAAPGAETHKYRAGSLSNGLFGGNSLFPSKMVARSASLSKEVTGRSRLLEDFRNNRIPSLQLKDLVNHVVEFSQDQHGSRFIQQKLERATPAEKAMVFNEILSAAYSLMTDVFGNYVIQKFFEFGSQDQKQTLAQRVRGHVLPLALQMYGCRVIQKALESIPSEMQVEIVKELDGHVLKCVKDQNGNHVVQKCIECVEPTQLQFIIDAFKGQVYSLSTHPYGCRVIQRILEHCTAEQTTPILEELHQQTERLVQDQYGNYVIQHVLEHGRPEDKSKIVQELRGKVIVLSQHKFASNVVEKCVAYCSRAEKAMLIDEVCSMSDGGLYTMMKDQFANYVVQKMIDVAEPSQRKLLMHKIRPHVATLRKFTYGKHILAKLEKFYMKSNAELGPIGMPPPNGPLP